MQIDSEYGYKVVTFTAGDKEALDILEKELDRRTVHRWTMKNGSTIDVRDMTVPHLEHAIAMIRRKLAEEDMVAEIGSEP